MQEPVAWPVPQLYLLQYENEDGVNMDLGVVAYDTRQAVDLWNGYYGKEPGVRFPGRLFVAVGITLPADAKPHALIWGSDLVEEKSK